MEKTKVEEKLQLIDKEISNALNTITELETKLSTIKTDEEGIVLKDDCNVLKNKFINFNESLGRLTKLLSELGIIDNDETK